MAERFSFDDSKTISQEQIDKDHEAARAWLESHPLTKIDSKGTWSRNGQAFKRREMPEPDYDWNAKWGNGGKKP